MIDMLRSRSFWAGFWKGYTRAGEILFPPAIIVIFCWWIGWL